MQKFIVSFLSGLLFANHSFANSTYSYAHGAVATAGKVYTLVVRPCSENDTLAREEWIAKDTSWQEVFSGIVNCKRDCLHDKNGLAGPLHKTEHRSFYHSKSREYKLLQERLTFNEKTLSCQESVSWTDWN